jgi:HSP20 family protein
LKISETGSCIKAINEGVENKRKLSICCPVIPGKAVANYSNGMLKITAPYQHFRRAN